MTNPTPAHWARYLRSAGITDWYTLPPHVQQQLSAQFPTWMRRQATIGRVIFAAFAVFAIGMIVVAVTTLV